MTPVWAQRREALLRDCLVSPDVFRQRVDRLGEFVMPYQRRFPRSEILQQSEMRLRSFCPENRRPCDGKVDWFILPRGWLSKGL